MPVTRGRSLRRRRGPSPSPLPRAAATSLRSARAEVRDSPRTRASPGGSDRSGRGASAGRRGAARGPRRLQLLASDDVDGDEATANSATPTSGGVLRMVRRSRSRGPHRGGASRDARRAADMKELDARFVDRAQMVVNASAPRMAMPAFAWRAVLLEALQRVLPCSPRHSPSDALRVLRGGLLSGWAVHPRSGRIATAVSYDPRLWLPKDQRWLYAKVIATRAAAAALGLLLGVLALLRGLRWEPAWAAAAAGRAGFAAVAAAVQQLLVMVAASAVVEGLIVHVAALPYGDAGGSDHARLDDAYRAQLDAAARGRLADRWEATAERLHKDDMQHVNVDVQLAAAGDGHRRPQRGRMSLFDLRTRLSPRGDGATIAVPVFRAIGVLAALQSTLTLLSALVDGGFVHEDAVTHQTAAACCATVGLLVVLPARLWRWALAAALVAALAGAQLIAGSAWLRALNASVCILAAAFATKVFKPATLARWVVVLALLVVSVSDVHLDHVNVGLISVAVVAAVGNGVCLFFVLWAIAAAVAGINLRRAGLAALTLAMQPTKVALFRLFEGNRLRASLRRVAEQLRATGDDAQQREQREQLLQQQQRGALELRELEDELSQDRGVISIMPTTLSLAALPLVHSYVGRRHQLFVDLACHLLLVVVAWLLAQIVRTLAAVAVARKRAEVVDDDADGVVGGLEDVLAIVMASVPALGCLLHFALALHRLDGERQRQGRTLERLRTALILDDACLRDAVEAASDGDDEVASAASAGSGTEDADEASVSHEATHAEAAGARRTRVSTLAGMADGAELRAARITALSVAIEQMQRPFKVALQLPFAAHPVELDSGKLLQLIVSAGVAQTGLKVASWVLAG